MIPRRPKPRPAKPEPLIPYIPPTPREPGPIQRAMAAGLVTPRRDSAALRISYGGCEWCGKPTKARGGTSCVDCQIREQVHRQRVTALAEREAELRIKLLERQLGEHNEGNTAS